MELLNKEIFNDCLREAKSICILGHVSPDGDCIGSTLGVYNYVKKLRAGEEFPIQVYLEDINEKFFFLNGSRLISSDSGDHKAYELAVVCDTADIKRLGKFDKYMNRASKVLLIDHHFTNEGFGDYGIIVGEASSACEVLYGLMDKAYFDKDIAECIYTGISHDSGVFKYSNTSPYTMQIAAECIGMGIDFGKIIEESFYSMTYKQKIVLGKVLGDMKSRLDGKLVYSWLTMDTRKELDAVDTDTDGIIDQIRNTSGALAGAFMYETKDGRVKLSLRSNSDLVDVSRFCQANGGGGHKKAAGCFLPMDFEKNMDDIEADIKAQLGLE